MARDGAEESDVIFMEPNEKGKKSNTYVDSRDQFNRCRDDSYSEILNTDEFTRW